LTRGEISKKNPFVSERNLGRKTKMVTRENNIWLERKKISTHLNDPPLVKKIKLF
jgi:hypothetical protein